MEEEEIIKEAKIGPGNDLSVPPYTAKSVCIDGESKAKTDKELNINFEQGVKFLSDQHIEKLPSKYILPPTLRPKLNEISMPEYDLPVIDLSDLEGDRRSDIVTAIGCAAAERGFFQVVNHGVSEMLIEEILKVSSEFFDLPLEERQQYMSGDVSKPIRYGISQNQLKDSIFYWRDFLKHCCDPLDEMIHMWPSNPPQHRRVVACYSEQIKLLALNLIAAMVENLGLTSKYMENTFKDISQMIFFNCYPPCPQPDLTFGLPPHSDHGCITILLQDGVGGLQVYDRGLWKPVKPLPGSFLINVGDQLEVLSNGRFKSPLHRVVVNAERLRVSVASALSLPFHMKISPFTELIDEEHPKMYRDTTFDEYMKSMACTQFKGTRFLDAIRLNGGQNL